MPGAVPEAEIRAHLEKVLSSQALARSPRLSRLLRYTVEKTLQGQGGELKEYRKRQTNRILDESGV